MKALVRNHPVVAYFALTFTIRGAPLRADIRRRVSVWLAAAG